MKSISSNLKEKIAFLRLKGGDSEAFAFFYDHYVKQIYRFISLKVANRQIAEDLTQDVFLKAWQYLVDQKQIKNFQAFIYRIARNVVVDYYRQHKAQDLPLEDFAEKEELSDETMTDKIDFDIDTEKLLHYLQKLKPEYQEVLLLRYVEDLSFEEISEICQKDKANIRVLLHRAMAKLKEIIKES